MSWNPTNANDVTLIISRVKPTGDDASKPQLANTAGVVVDDFSIDTEEDLQGLSGIGHRTPQGISKGDVEHTFSFTIQGEDADIFRKLSSGADNTDFDDAEDASQLLIEAKFDKLKIELSGAYAGTRSISGSSGDPVEIEVEGMATDKSTTTISSEEEGEGEGEGEG